MNWREAKLAFPVGHPSAAGHFPGNPIIPGAVTLDAVLDVIGGAQRDVPMLLRSAKFLRVVRPGDNLQLRWRDAVKSGVEFECRLAGETELALTGHVEFKAAIS